MVVFLGVCVVGLMVNGVDVGEGVEVFEISLMGCDIGVVLNFVKVE